MKFNPRLGDGRNLTAADAWACCTGNCAFPGSGSLLAGRRIGYAQSLLAGIGFVLTLWFGSRFLAWGVRHWSELMHPSGDPLDFLESLWQGVRGTLFGIGIFAFSWTWALLTSLSILRAARQREKAIHKPPVIH